MVLRKKFSDLDSYPATKAAMKEKLGVTNLEEKNITGVTVVDTYADEGAGTFLPVTGVVGTSYKVANDPTPSNNGYYHWSGAVYIKDATLNEDALRNSEDLTYLANIQYGYEINVDAVAASNTAYNLVSTEPFTAGTIAQIKVNANANGTLKFAVYRKLTSSPFTYKVIKQFNESVSIGVNIIKVSIPIEEDFYFGILANSVSILTESADVGAPYDLHYFSGVFNDSSTWTVLSGRTTNIEIKVVKGVIGENNIEAYNLKGFRRIENSFAFNGAYAAASSASLNITNSEVYLPGRIRKIKLNAVSDGICKFACLRKLTSDPTYKIIKYFEAKVLSGENEIEVNLFVDEEFSFCLLAGSTTIYTAPSPVGDNISLVYSTGAFTDATVWNTQSGRGNNIEIEIESGIVEETEIIKTGKTFCIIGDSITDFCDSPSSNGVQYIGYDKHINRIINFKQILNQGFSGIKLAQAGGVADAKVASLPVADVYSSMLGTNDFALVTNTVVGTISDFFNNTGINTFYGAYRVLIDGIYAKNSQAKIILFTPSHRDYSSLNSWDDVNSNGNTLNDFAEAVREVGLYTGLPVVDLMKDCQINYQTFADTTYDNLHPTTRGYQLIADAFVAKVKNYLV